MINDKQLAYVRHRLTARNGMLDSNAGVGLPAHEEARERFEAFLQFSKLADEPAESFRWRKVFDAVYGVDSSASAAHGASDAMAEAIVIADGSRPIYFLRNDRLEKLGRPTGRFVELLDRNATAIELAALSVGRIETDDQVVPDPYDKAYFGTAFLVAPGVAMTNRHVIEAMVLDPTATSTPYSLNAAYWLNFDAQEGSPTARRFRIEEVLFAGDEVIGESSEFSKLDLALLRIGSGELAKAIVPPPLRLSSTSLRRADEIIVIGYPGRPRLWYGPGEPNGAMEIEEVLRRLLDDRFGFKRCASGEIDAVPGFQGDSRGWTVMHDASTLGGNSGSPILQIRNGQISVPALHYGGLSRVGNYGHALEKIAVQLQALGVPIEA